MPGYEAENDQHLVEFITWLVASSHLAPSSVGNYLTHVNWWHTVMRPDGVRPYSPSLSPRACHVKSIAAHDRLLKQVKQPKYKMAAGTEVMRAILRAPISEVDPGTKAACLLCFFALLRRSEAVQCWNGTTRRRDVRMTRRCLRRRVDRSGNPFLQLFIVGKGNVNNAGRTRLVGSVRDSWVDPVAYIWRHIQRTDELVPGDGSGPAFVFECRHGARSAGSPVTGDDVGRAVKWGARAIGLDPSLYASHSLRIGGASALAAAGMRDWELMVMGRWTSWTFLRYLRMDQETLIGAACMMAATNIRGVLRT